MAHKGRKVTFHGAFDKKAEAVKKESETPNSYIRETDVKGVGKRFLVLTRNK